MKIQNRYVRFKRRSDVHITKIGREFNVFDWIFVSVVVLWINWVIYISSINILK